MVYAMFSIGILGFIVWSHLSLLFTILKIILDLWVVALFFCEEKVINFANWRQIWIIIDTLICKILVSKIKAARNIWLNKKYLSSSSETKRETSFKFSLFLDKYYNKTGKEAPDFYWLIWFIGFSEGDGAILTYEGRLRFVLTQKEGSILKHIQGVLGFGNLREFKNYSRLIVENKQEIILLYHLFNGNLVLEHRKSQLSQWQEVLNKEFNLKLELINRLLLPSLSDAWLSGFTDAEGCFNVNIEQRLNTKTGYRVVLRFILDQKEASNLFLHIRDLFGYGQVNLRSNTNSIYRYHVNTFKGLITVRNYFLTYPLKTKKKESFNKWNKVYDMVLNKEHLVSEGLNNIRIIAKEINKENSLE